MELPRFLRGVELDEPTETDISVINERLSKQGSSESTFVIKSEERRYRVVAVALKISENELDIFDSPFDIYDKE